MAQPKQQQIGRLNRRVCLMRRTTTRNEANEPLGQWASYATVWAYIDILYSQRVYSTNEFVERATSIIIIRYNKNLGIRVSDRVQFIDPATGSVHVYLIQNVNNPAQQNQFLELTVQEIGGAQ